MSSPPAKSPLSLTALSLKDAAMLLSRISSTPVGVAILKRHVAEGAPLNPDRTLNLVHYTAWLVREVARGD